MRWTRLESREQIRAWLAERERILRALVEGQAVVSARVCACGCMRSLEGRRRNCIYVDGTHRKRGHDARKRSPRVEPSTDASVTLAEAPTPPTGCPRCGGFLLVRDDDDAERCGKCGHGVTS